MSRHSNRLIFILISLAAFAFAASGCFNDDEWNDFDDNHGHSCNEWEWCDPEPPQECWDDFCEGPWDDPAPDEPTNETFCDCWSSNPVDCYCYECFDGFCEEVDPEDLEDQPNGPCGADGLCGDGLICDVYNTCIEAVLDCPLTDECLADPEAWTPVWQGIDPTYVGDFSGEGFSGRMHVDIDFYDDHLYGEGDVVITYEEGLWEEWYYVVITGYRDGDYLHGQILDSMGGRTYDLTFEGTLLDASQISGTFYFASDEGNADGTFHVLRTSACGCEIPSQPAVGCETELDCAAGELCINAVCEAVTEPDPGCESDAQCAADELCVDAECVTAPPVDGPCLYNTDCSVGLICVDAQCVATCASASECAAGETCYGGMCLAEDEVPQVDACNNSCVEGTECFDGACEMPCELSCQCDAGFICGDAGFCVENVPAPQPRACETDCDCDYNGGELCVEGFCSAAP